MKIYTNIIYNNKTTISLYIIVVFGSCLICVQYSCYRIAVMARVVVNRANEKSPSLTTPSTTYNHWTTTGTSDPKPFTLYKNIFVCIFVVIYILTAVVHVIVCIFFNSSLIPFVHLRWNYYFCSAAMRIVAFQIINNDDTRP